MRLKSALRSIRRRINPFESSGRVLRHDDTLTRFVWRASGAHQFYVGIIAVGVALLNFVPIDLQRRIVDESIQNKNLPSLIFLASLYLGVLLLQALLKYVLLLYQGWVGESAVKTSRDQIAKVAASRGDIGAAESGQTVNVIGREIDNVGGFVGTSISEFVVNLTLLIVIALYMLYIQPIIALVSAVFLVPQIVLALYMQADLNVLVERQVGLVRQLGSETVADGNTGEGAGHKTIRAIFRNRIHFYVLKYGLKTLLNIANSMGPLMVLIVGGYLVIQGQSTIGTVVAFVSGFERLSSPLRDLLNFYREYEQAKVQHAMIVDWIEAAPGSDVEAKQEKSDEISKAKV